MNIYDHRPSHDNSVISKANTIVFHWCHFFLSKVKRQTHCLYLVPVSHCINTCCCSDLSLRKMKKDNPTQFPTDRLFTYGPKTSNTSKCVHIKRYHLEVYLEEAEKNSWMIWLETVKVAFKAGYSFQTLHQALATPNMSIQSLPSLHWGGDQGTSSFPSGHIPLENGLPPFSISALQQYLMQFIIMDNQVCASCSELSILLSRYNSW